mgnify:CR=1 FL=1
MKKQIIISLMAVVITVTVLIGCQKRGYVATPEATTESAGAYVTGERDRHLLRLRRLQGSV